MFRFHVTRTDGILANLRTKDFLLNVSQALLLVFTHFADKHVVVQTGNFRLSIFILPGSFSHQEF